MTLFRICPALRPRSGRRARPLRHADAAPATATTKAPTSMALSRLNHTASTVAAYASRLGHPARARLASGCWPALPGGIGYPQGHYRRFPCTLPPSPVLAWRDPGRAGQLPARPPHSPVRAVFPHTVLQVTGSLRRRSGQHPITHPFCAIRCCFVNTSMDSFVSSVSPINGSVTRRPPYLRGVRWVRSPASPVL